MSKRSLFWNDSSGKLGNVVNYRAGGEQRSRQYVAKIKNPKTLPQQLQRISMLNYNSVFKSLNFVLRSAFPLKAVNQSAWNAFVSVNKNAPRVAISRADLEKGVCMPAGLFVAKGDVIANNTLEYFGGATNALNASGMGMDAVCIAATKGIVTTVGDLGYPAGTNVQGNFSLNGSDLYKIFSDNGLIPANPAAFKLTFFFGSYQDESTGSNDAYKMSVFQILCDASSKDAGKWLINAVNAKKPIITFGSAIDGDLGANTTTNVQDIIVGTGIDQMEAPIVGMIISWTENGKVRCTTTRLEAREADAAYINQYRQGSEEFAETLMMLGVGESEALGTVGQTPYDNTVGLALKDFVSQTA